ncbi:uncharacterized protein PITG_04575 [Phytophthora infestans T30-4]|uniref:Uncharacterized protein n=1 Tax=Phytophthora infestans (strain T30-4) TaxID=403677 RepID=D0N1J7_PHYIT|nr:uncharacterized protein PITG_04575 [Phytophthora infestans T30-4]EEY68176.1 conserved hypothetical protein [Phytophthora infestans T30-4]|eukprot:XP_002905335.1 conserved hypothetical protein [Phytophthora infestans T30-4]
MRYAAFASSIAVSSTNRDIAVTNQRDVGSEKDAETAENNKKQQSLGFTSKRRTIACSISKSAQADFLSCISCTRALFSNGSSHEEVTPPPTRSDPPKPDNILAEDVHYYVVGENMSMTTTCQGIDSASEAKPDNSMKRDKCTSNQDAKECAEDKVDKTTIHDAQVSKDVRSFVTSLVERVVKKMASDVTASTAPAVADGSSGNSTGKVPVNGVAKVKVGAKSLASNSAVDVQKRRSSESKDSGRKQSASVHVESQLFGSHRECEDIQTSLHRMAGHLELLKSSRVINPREAQLKPRSPETPTPASELALATCESKQGDFHDEQSYLTALRTKYGPGVSGCAEQVITLVDYYRDFERRTDLSEIWKARITKLEKIESSLSEYVQHLNIPAGLRQDFIKVHIFHISLDVANCSLTPLSCAILLQDLIAYLRESWTIRDRRCLLESQGGKVFPSLSPT